MKIFSPRRLLAAALVFVAVGPAHRSGLAATETVIHRFVGSDGKSPLGRLTIGPDGTLYGTTHGGGKGVLYGTAYIGYSNSGEV